MNQLNMKSVSQAAMILALVASPIQLRTALGCAMGEVGGCIGRSAEQIDRDRQESAAEKIMSLPGAQAEAYLKRFDVKLRRALLNAVDPMRTQLAQMSQQMERAKREHRKAYEAISRHNKAVYAQQALGDFEQLITGSGIQGSKISSEVSQAIQGWEKQKGNPQQLNKAAENMEKQAFDIAEQYDLLVGRIVKALDKAARPHGTTWSYLASILED